MRWFHGIVAAACVVWSVAVVGAPAKRGELQKPPLFGITIDEQNGPYDPAILKDLGVRWQRRSTVEYPQVIGKDYAHLDWDAQWKGWEQPGGLVYEKDPMYGIRAQGIEIIAFVSSLHDPPKDMEDYRKYAYHVTDHLANKSGLNIRRFEVGNEVNLKHFWSGSVEEYAEMMRVTIEEIRRACPEALISHGSATGRNWRKWFGELFEYRYADGKRAADLFDCSDIHLYVAPEGMAEAVASWYRFLNDHDTTIKELWVTEAAIQSRPEGRWISERRQAVDLMKIYIVGASVGIDALCWFSLNDRIRSTERDRVRFMGLRFVEDRKPVPEPSYNKLSFWTYQNLTRLTEEVDWETITKLDSFEEYPQIWGYRVKAKDGMMYFFWKQCQDSIDREEVKFTFRPTLNLGIPNGNYRLVELVPKGETGKAYKDEAEFTERLVKVDSPLEIKLSDSPIALIPMAE